MAVRSTTHTAPALRSNPPTVPNFIPPLAYCMCTYETPSESLSPCGFRVPFPTQVVMLAGCLKTCSLDISLRDPLQLS